MLTVMLTVALIASFFAALPAANAEIINLNASNQKLAATVNVTYEDTVEINTENVVVTITVTNDNVEVDRGIPQVAIIVNNEQVAFYDNIGKGETQTTEIPVNTDISGPVSFDIAVWSRIGNSQFEQKLFSGKAEIIVEAPAPKTPNDWLADFNNALENALVGVTNPTDILVTLPGNNRGIILTIDDKEYTFIGGKGTNADRFLVIEGITYMINYSGNPATFSISYTLP
jgi:hypothetical protein